MYAWFTEPQLHTHTAYSENKISERYPSTILCFFLLELVSVHTSTQHTLCTINKAYVNSTVYSSELLIGLCDKVYATL